MKLRSLPRDELVASGGYEVNRHSIVTSDGQYWAQSSKGSWFASVGEPDGFWKDWWNKRCVREVLKS